ncbi:MAG: hypothetical protein JO170_30045 [Verrucomicrobia bacterium]|nr:hypothetical protein [Verrucomicrobiota bacterium]
MGAYKGRVNLRKRRSRFANAKRIKALAARSSDPLRSPAESSKSPEEKSIDPDNNDVDGKEPEH